MTDHRSSPPRWHLRFENFRRAVGLLGQAVERAAAGTLNDLEREGLAQRFEYSWELGWKTMRDFLREGGIQIGVPMPANVIRAAFESGLIADGDAWIAAKAARNQLAHEYDQHRFDAIVADVVSRHYPLLKALEHALDQERSRGN